MKIPKYWAKGVQSAQEPDDGRKVTFVCWQWSDESIAQAQEQADSRVRELAQKFLSDAPLNRYAYGDRPLREEILQAVTNRAGQEIALVTRNAYGAQVLNAAKAMFIDIDFPKEGLAGSLTGRFQQLLGKAPPSQEERYTQGVVAWGAAHPDLGIRIYRTLAGLRCLITNQLFEPTQADAQNILSALKSDPLYIRLCQVQECFRARLTPKPWRCGIEAPPSRYPWDDAAAEARYRQWEQGYARVVSQYAACRFVTQIGAKEIHPDLEPVLSLHDKLACSAHDLKLA